MPGTNAAEIVVGANGKILVADLATAAPADPFAAWPAGWVDLGFASEAGVKMHDGKTMAEIKAWQSFYTVRRLVTARDFKLSFALVQFNKTLVPLAFGGGTVTAGVGAGAATVSNKALTANVATITTTAPHGFVVGAQVTVAGVGAPFNGTWTIATVPTSTTFTYADTAANVASAASAGTATSPAWYKYSPPSPQTVDEREMGIEWTDGTKIYRVIVPKGMVVDPVDVEVARTKEVSLPIGFDITAGDVSIDAWYMLTNDPAFA
jgi:hypothetical protein